MNDKRITALLLIFIFSVGTICFYDLARREQTITMGYIRKMTKMGYQRGYLQGVLRMKQKEKNDTFNWSHQYTLDTIAFFKTIP